MILAELENPYASPLFEILIGAWHRASELKERAGMGGPSMVPNMPNRKAGIHLDFRTLPKL